LFEVFFFPKSEGSSGLVHISLFELAAGVLEIKKGDVDIPLVLCYPDASDMIEVPFTSSRTMEPCGSLKVGLGLVPSQQLQLIAAHGNLHLPPLPRCVSCAILRGLQDG
jgi:hypothetical protein